LAYIRSNIRLIYQLTLVWGFFSRPYVNNDTYTTINKTQNQGSSWDTIYISQNTSYSIKDTYFNDTLKGWAVGDNAYQYLILYTENGGETWEEQTIEEPPAPLVANCVYFINDTTGWIGTGLPGAGYPYGAIYFTNDGGECWQLQQEFESGGIFDIQMLNQDTGWAVGGDFVYHINNATTIVKESSNQDFLITINPNPSNGIFSIQNNPQLSIIKYQISDITGKTIISGSNIPLHIDISIQPKGIYFLSIKYHTNNQIHLFTKKLIKL
nr:T9SS type A sorting domain-containing protein [Bacteroidota bacterium]